MARKSTKDARLDTMSQRGRRRYQNKNTARKNDLTNSWGANMLRKLEKEVGP